METATETATELWAGPAIALFRVVREEGGRLCLQVWIDRTGDWEPTLYVESIEQAREVASEAGGVLLEEDLASC